MARQRDNLIAFRTTEGSMMEQIHQKAKADGENIKAIIESWAEQFALSKTGEKEDE